MLRSTTESNDTVEHKLIETIYIIPFLVNCLLCELRELQSA